MGDWTEQSQFFKNLPKIWRVDKKYMRFTPQNIMVKLQMVPKVWCVKVDKNTPSIKIAKAKPKRYISS